MLSTALYPRDDSTPPDQYQVAIQKQSFDGQFSRHSVIATLSIALGLYNSLEMVLLILTTFKKWKGLYFWSLTLCNLGVMLYSIGIMITYFELCTTWLCVVILDLGWLLMVICQSLVLFSRLNLILENLTLLKAIRWYIILNSSLLAINTLVLEIGVTYTKTAVFAKGYFYIEHIQIAGFTLQEVIISGVYVWKTIKFLQIVSKAHTRSMIWQLMAINVVIIAMDILLIFLQFERLQLYQECIKGFVYSVKLKLELNILSRLVDLVHGPSTENRSMTLATVDSNTIVGQVQVDIQREMTGQDTITKWLGNGKKVQTNVKQCEGSQISQDSHNIESAHNPFTGHLSDDEGVSRVRSQTSTYSTRTNGRESDVMYADMLRSIMK